MSNAHELVFMKLRPAHARPFCTSTQATTAARRTCGLALPTLVLALGMAACGPVVAPELDGSSSSAGNETALPPGTTAPPPSTSTTGITTVGPTDDPPPTPTTIECGSGECEDQDGVDDACFVFCPIDVGPHECDLFMQDCDAGEKCAPWSSDGTETWNGARCVPIFDNPGQPGDPCTVEEHDPHSGIDTCDLGTVCLHANPLTDAGTCVALCFGTEAKPGCEDPQRHCIFLDELVPVCLPSCNPLMPECAADEGCYAAADDAFVCWTPAETAGIQGDECDSSNGCMPGHACVAAEDFSGCMGELGCCAQYCDVATGLPCPTDEGVVCLPWYDDGMAPPGYENVGYCALP